MALRTRIVLAVSLLALALPGAAFAAGWTGFANVPTSGAQITGLKFASDSAGNQVAIWVEQPSPFKVMASVRPTGGTWTTPQTLDSTATTQPITDLAVDASGNFIVLYSRVIGTNDVILSAYLPTGSTAFGSSQTFTSVTGGPTTRGVAVAFAPSGTAWAVAAFSTSDVGGSRPGGSASTWSLNSTGLPVGSGATAGVDLAVTSDGTPTFADTPAAGGALRHSRFGGAAWTTINTPAGAGNPTGIVRVMADANNQTTTLYQVASTWTQLGTQSCPQGTTAATLCTPRATLDASTTTSALNPVLAVNPATGDAIAAWTENTSVFVARRSGPTGPWSAAGQIATGATPGATFDSTNGVFTAFADGSNHLQFLSAPSGIALTPPTSPLTDPSQTWSTPTLAADGSGDVMGAWVSAANTAIQSAIYDVQPPSTPALTAPSSATAGSPVTFTAAANDTWGAVTYAWDFGDGATDTGASTSHTYSSAGTYTARVTATDGAGNQSSQTQIVSIAAAPPVTPPPNTLPPPVLGTTINVYVLKDPVFIKLPGERKFHRLIKQAHLPNGTVIDTRKGRVLVVIDNGHGGTDSAEFYEGVFEVNQPKSLKGLANIFLNGGGFKGCPKAPKDPHAQLSAKNAKKPSPTRSVRHLWGKGSGNFRTVGRFASATVRGTNWLTDDKCNGTLVRVKQGKVAVRDFVKQKTIALPAPKSYFARARKR